MFKVWIDAGHGGKDPGAVANGLLEKDIALKVSLGIKACLGAAGCTGDFVEIHRCIPGAEGADEQGERCRC
ncbi:N-acetylmuramoyl-L-alanine amidase [Paenibacillus marchantiae]|uniref:N-acetylmuramoyl-L-alanine amidase n=1 Tax=Paenibacillus marchantiae TaxID=3026433 RepID=UPI0030844A23